MFNFKKFSAIADRHNIHGWGIFVYFTIAPIAYGVGWIYGWLKGFFLAITGKL